MRTIMPEAVAGEFESEGEADFSLSLPEVGRFRVNAFTQRGSASIVMHHIPFGVPRFEDVGLPEAISHLAREERGIVLITGTRRAGRGDTAGCARA